MAKPILEKILKKPLTINGITRNNLYKGTKPKRPVGRPPGSKKDIKITLKEQMFCNLILENSTKPKGERLTQSECFRIAYSNYTMKDNSAQVTSSKLLKKPKLQRYIQQRKRAAAEKVDIKVSRVLTGLLRIAEFDPRKLMDKRGRPIPVHKLSDDIALGLSGMEFKRIINITPTGQRRVSYIPHKIKHEARKPAWELIGNYLNMFSGMNNQTSAEDFVSEMRQFANDIASMVPGGKI